MKLTRRHNTVLSFLSANDGWCAPRLLPDGNGRAGCASAKTLRELRDWKLVEYGKEPKHSHFGYRITPAGREALEKERGE